MSQIIHIAGDGEFAFDIVGENQYQHVLKRIAGDKAEDGKDYYCTARLTPESDNPYDSNAVAVFIMDHKVGYLSREAAKVWNAMLAKYSRRNRSTHIDAVIVGGWRRDSDGSEGNYGVKLDI